MQFAPYPVPSGMSQIARIKHIKNDLFSQIYYPLNTLTKIIIKEKVMELIEIIKKISNNYEYPLKSISKDKNKVITDISNEIITQSIPEHLFNYKTHIKRSYGQGNRAEIPWIAIFDEELTKSAQKGFYIVYLFTNDYKGVYLTLNQGYSIYKDNFGSNYRMQAIRKVSNFWKEHLSTINENNGFSINDINLARKKSNNDKLIGYELGTIYSKYYDINKLEYEDNDILLNDLAKINTVYMELKSKLISSDDPISETINAILNEENINLLNNNTIDKIKKIEDKKDLKLLKNNHQDLTKTKKVYSNKNYLEEHKRNIETGIKGEELVMNYEKKRLADNDKLSAYADNILHTSMIKGDGYGYDIESFDLFDEKVKKIFIEVKTTSGDSNTPFFMSQNEINVSREKGDKYRIYFVSNYNDMEPTLQIIDDIENSLELSPTNYIVKFKNNNN